MNIMKLVTGLVAACLLAVGSANAATITMMNEQVGVVYDSASILTPRGSTGTNGTSAVTIVSLMQLSANAPHQFKFTVSGATDLLLGFTGSTSSSASIALSDETTSLGILQLNPVPGSFIGLVSGTIYTLDLTGEANFPYHVTLQSVPLPAAVWLFGSALVGFGFISRRKRA